MIDHVLVPMDHGPLARRALEFALEVHPDADITVLHVVDYVEESYGAAALVGPERLRERAERRAEDLFEAATETAADHDHSLRTEVRFGPPGRTIVDFADQASVDLIVMGTHGRPVLSRVLLGDTAQSVVQRAPVPVTVVR